MKEDFLFLTIGLLPGENSIEPRLKFNTPSFVVVEHVFNARNLAQHTSAPPYNSSLFPKHIEATQDSHALVYIRYGLSNPCKQLCYVAIGLPSSREQAAIGTGLPPHRNIAYWVID